MDNNLDAKQFRLNPYGTAPGQIKRETLPPLPMDQPSPTFYGTLPMQGTTTGYPSQMGYQQFSGFPTMPAFPAPPATGFAGAPAFPSTGDLAPLTPFNQPIPVTTENILFLNAFLRTMIGRRVTVEFLIGTNTLTDRTGTLLAVGANYIVINEVETDDLLICDFYTIKFVKVYY